MNNLTLWIYSIELTAKLSISLLFFCGLIILSILCIAIDRDFTQQEKENKISKRIKRISAFLLIIFLIPSKKTMYAMLGVNVINKIVENERIDSITQKSILLLEKKIDNLLK